MRPTLVQPAALFITCCFLASCEGDVGPTGPAGTAGPAGPAGQPGIENFTASLS